LHTMYWIIYNYYTFFELPQHAIKFTIQHSRRQLLAKYVTELNVRKSPVNSS
jgi:hypothetical protein